MTDRTPENPGDEPISEFAEDTMGQGDAAADSADRVEIVDAEPQPIVELEQPAPDADATQEQSVIADAPTAEQPDDANFYPDNPFARPKEMPDDDYGQVAPAAMPLYRDEAPAPETTAEMPVVDERDYEAEREARNKALGVRTRGEADQEPLVPPRKPKRTTDKWHGSLGFFILRVAVAALIGLRGWQHLTNFTQTKAYFANSVLPQTDTIALVVVIVEFTIAVLLALGLLTRVAGLLLIAWSVLMVGWYVWGSEPILSSTRVGLLGEFELLMGIIGLIFLLLGAGGWAVDAAFRRSRVRAKERKVLGDTV